MVQTEKLPDGHKIWLENTKNIRPYRMVSATYGHAGIYMLPGIQIRK